MWSENGRSAGLTRGKSHYPPADYYVKVLSIQFILYLERP